jgi:hypothetical protein
MRATIATVATQPPPFKMAGGVHLQNIIIRQRITHCSIRKKHSHGVSVLHGQRPARLLLRRRRERVPRRPQEGRRLPLRARRTLLLQRSIAPVPGRLASRDEARGPLRPRFASGSRDRWREQHRRRERPLLPSRGGGVTLGVMHAGASRLLRAYGVRAPGGRWC